MRADRELDSQLDTELAGEQQHLEQARAALARMRAAAAHLGDVGADAWASESLGRSRAVRLAQLADDPGTALFFGRLDQQADEQHPAGETFHVGRRHIRDEVGDPLVIDWRAGISRAFYRATPGEPMGVRRRRRFGVAGGRLTGFEDERLDRPDGDHGTSRLLLAEIERPRVGPMRDIVATIQPDQDDIVRAPLEQSICVQGAPGTGKTAVGLHRAAYLLYSYPDQLKRGGVLVVGPNTAFLAYVSAVLPALGEVGVQQVSVDALAAGVRVRGTDDPSTASLKGDARMARVLRRAVYAGITRPTGPVAVLVGSRRLRVQPELLRRWVDDLRRGDLPYAAARARLAAHLAHDVRRQLEAEGMTPTDAATDRIARSAAVRDAVQRLLPAVDPARLLIELFTDPDRLAHAARGILDEGEQRQLHWATAPRSPGSARWSAADAFLLDEVAGLLERHSSYGHVIVDEAQDLSPMQCRAIARRCTLGSLTVLGDLAQGTAPWATSDWAQSLAHLGKDGARIEPLTRGYRVPGEVIALANRLMPTIAPGLPMGESIRAGHDALAVVPVRSVLAALPDHVTAAVAREGTLGIIVADAGVRSVRRTLERAGIEHALLGEAEQRVVVVPAGLAKGLEFDEVIVVEPARIVAGEPRGLRRLYVVLTRAVSRLVLLHAEPLPEQLLG